MEIYKTLDSDASKEFQKLLNQQLSSSKNLSEGKIVVGKVTKITSKYLFLFIPGLKSEPVLDVNELKQIGLENKIKVDEEIEVFVENIEDKNGEVQVSANKALKIKGWEKIVKAYDNNEPIMGKIVSKVKGGVIVEHTDTGSLMFCPGSQISDKPLKDISHLMREPQKFALIKLDKIRGNACVSRKQIINSHKKEDKEKIIAKYKVGDKIKNAIVKSYSSFGVFFDVNSELDVLVHLQEISYSRVNHPDEIFNIGDKHELLVISVDNEKLQVGCSIKQLSPDPFEHISNYDLNKTYDVKVVKIMDFGAFCELEPGLSSLLHSSELSWTKKNPSAKKMFKIGDVIKCVITDIDKEKRRISLSHKLTLPNPYDELEKKYPVGSKVSVTISSKNEYAIYVKMNELDIDAFLHCNDLSYTENGESELSKYKKGDKLDVQVVEIEKSKQKIRVSKKLLDNDPFEFFKDKKVNDTLTVQVISSDPKGLLVKPEGSELKITIKKSQIAINSADARPSRFVGGERIDAAISEINTEKRKVALSIRLLEELKNKEALDKYSDPLSGKNLPFSSLSDKIEKKKE